MTIHRSSSRDSVKDLTENDWDLSITRNDLTLTLDQRTKLLQKTNKSLNNPNIIENKFNAFVDDNLQDNLNLHIKVNSKNIKPEEI